MMKTIPMFSLSRTLIASFVLAAGLLPACGSSSVSGGAPEDGNGFAPADTTGWERAYFASGCFWCVEAIFESVRGVQEAVSGYAGGEQPDPTYREVAAGRTRHAETVEVWYDPGAISYRTLLTVFFDSHDPTTKDRQGPDVGPQYRSIAFYRSGEEKRLIEAHIEQLNAGESMRGPVVTEVTPFRKFWPAEEYHQDYERRNPNQPYIRSVSIPRLNRFKARHPELLKPDASH